MARRSRLQLWLDAERSRAARSTPEWEVRQRPMKPGEMMVRWELRQRKWDDELRAFAYHTLRVTCDSRIAQGWRETYGEKRPATPKPLTEIEAGMPIPYHRWAVAIIIALAVAVIIYNALVNMLATAAQ